MENISYIQRKLNIGYKRTGDIMDQLEQLGVVSSYKRYGFISEDFKEFKRWILFFSH